MKMFLAFLKVACLTINLRKLRNHF